MSLVASVQDAQDAGKGRPGESFIARLQVGMRFHDVPLAVHAIRLENYRDRPGHYISMTLGDSGGAVRGVKWDSSPDEYACLSGAEVVLVSGQVRRYRGQLQITVEKAREAGPDEYELSDFLPRVQKNRGELLRRLLSAVQSVRNPHLKALLDRFFGDPEWLKRFQDAPAAKAVHQAYLGGLLEHTVHVLEIALTIQGLYQQADRDLLVAGVLLHDVGKLREYQLGASIEVSDEGALLGHISIGDALIVEKAASLPSFPEELLLRLRHLILSHHGQYEWGSPCLPKTLEACVLHYADLADARVSHVSEVMAAGRGQSGWSDYDRTLERRLYLGAAEEEQTDQAQTSSNEREDGTKGSDLFGTYAG